MAVLLVAAASGCTLDLDALRRGTEDAGVDGGALDAAVDGGALDAGADAGAWDAGADAGADGGTRPDGSVVSDAGTVGPPSCEGLSRDVDDFDGAALLPHWNLTALGAPPTYTVSGSWLRITDAALANTPSSPALSWIYQLDQDRGNQMAWAQPIGSGDFEVYFESEWSSEAAELTLGGLALTDASGYIQVLAGFVDDRGGAAGLGTPFARVQQPTTDDQWVGASAQTGTATFLVQRVGGALTVQVDGAEILASTTAADIAAVAVVTVRHRTAGGAEPPFGAFGLDLLVVCY